MNAQPDHLGPELLAKIEANFHAVIRSRAADLVAQHRLEERGTELVLVTES